MKILFWYICFVFVCGSFTAYYGLVRSVRRTNYYQVLGLCIGQTFYVIMMAIFLFNVYPLIN